MPLTPYEVSAVSERQEPRGKLPSPHHRGEHQFALVVHHVALGDEVGLSAAKRRERFWRQNVGGNGPMRILPDWSEGGVRQSRVTSALWFCYGGQPAIRSGDGPW